MKQTRWRTTTTGNNAQLRYTTTKMIHEENIDAQRTTQTTTDDIQRRQTTDNDDNIDESPIPGAGRRQPRHRPRVSREPVRPSATTAARRTPPEGEDTRRTHGRRRRIGRRRGDVRVP